MLQPVTGNKKGISLISLNQSVCLGNVHEIHGHPVPEQNRVLIRRKKGELVGGQTTQPAIA